MSIRTEQDEHGIGAAGRVVLEEGLVLTIEPMLTARGPAVPLRPDVGTVCTDDGGRSAHHEHALVVTRRGPSLVTASWRFT